MLTVAPREFFEPKGGRQGWVEFVSEAVKENRVLDHNKKGGYDLSVIAQQARLGDITEASLKDNIAQFRREVNSFKQKNRISYSRKNSLDEADIAPKTIKIELAGGQLGINSSSSRPDASSIIIIYDLFQFVKQ